MHKTIVHPVRLASARTLSSMELISSQFLATVLDSKALFPALNRLDHCGRFFITDIVQIIKMKDIIRDSTIGQIIRCTTGNKVFQYVEETTGFQCPHCYASSLADVTTISRRLSDVEKTVSGQLSHCLLSYSVTQTPMGRGNDEPDRSEPQREMLAALINQLDCGNSNAG